MVAAKESHVAIYVRGLLGEKRGQLVHMLRAILKCEMQFRVMQWDLEVKTYDDSDNL